jgi:NADP-dependent 3-hydroxy acid dehydrogenase YdfG
MTDDPTRSVMVTGASAGIGRAVAVELGRLGWRVALGARSPDRLDAAADEVRAAGGRAFARVLDVTDADSVDAFVDAAEAELGPIDGLVNNAGAAYAGDVTDMPVDQIRTTVATNVLGSLFPARRIGRSLLDRGAAGDIVFISSDTVHNPRPGLVTYGATKAAVEHIAIGLAYELEGRGIRVSTVRVGPTATSFADDWHKTDDEYNALFRNWQRFGSQRHFQTMEPVDVARAVVTVLTAPAGVHLPLVEVQPEPPVEP